MELFDVIFGKRQTFPARENDIHEVGVSGDFLFIP